MSYLESIIAVVVFVFLWFIISGAFEERDHIAETMQECLQDGKKEYECEYMLKARTPLL